ncbi:MAG: hypothetical protein CVT80_07200, partial [Alphaproteobacteria bacterium HGW-Alphaproteobacteria-2]
GLLERIETCLEHSGGEGFVAPFLDLVQAAGADQIMIFAYAGGGATCLLSRNFDEARLGARLASDYLADGFAQDPLHPRILALAPGAAELHRLADHLGAMPPDYRARFFDRPGIRDKSAVLVAGRRLRIAVNFYWRATVPVADALARLLARLALWHFEADPEPGLPAPLSALSTASSPTGAAPMPSWASIRAPPFSRSAARHRVRAWRAPPDRAGGGRRRRS